MLLIYKTTNAQTGTSGANFPPQQSEDKTKIIFENLTIRLKPSRELKVLGHYVWNFPIQHQATKNNRSGRLWLLRKVSPFKVM